MQTEYDLTAATNAAAAKRTDTVAGAMLAAMLGVLIIGLVGFSHVDVFHNAAHDVRHSNGFPCH